MLSSSCDYHKISSVHIGGTQYSHIFKPVQWHNRNVISTTYRK